MAQRQTTIIPKAPVARILMRQGAKRVSAEAVDAFVEILEAKAAEIGEKASQIAVHSGRKTVQDVDIKLASKS